MDILLAALGSAGDLHPFIGLGLALRGRGHRATIISYTSHRPLIERVGLEFVALGEPKATGRTRGSSIRRVVGAGCRAVGRRWAKLARASTLIPPLRPLYAIIAERYVPGQTVVVASSTALGARVAHDKFGVPLVTVHLCPAMFRSVHEPPVQPPLVLPAWLPVGVKRTAYRLLDAVVFDPLVGTPLNAFRAELGLPPVRRPFADWRHAPQRVIGLFPPWFAKPQPDWPAQTRLTGFPLYDESGVTDLPADARRFLTEATPPIVFTPGSAMRRGEHFFHESVRACQQLGRRGVLLSRFREHLPARLPDGVRHFEYLPFSQVLPHAAAPVHHGGIGTTAQALAAGIPQLISPGRHDQPDNARRVQQLGVAQVLSPSAYRAPALAEALQFLLDSPEVASRCQMIAARFARGNSLAETCRLIEELNPVVQARAA